MNEEEKQAIHKLKSVINNDTGVISDDIQDDEIETILGLINKQQKEIEERLKEIDSLYKMMSVKDDEIEKLKEDYQILKDDIEEHNIAYVDTPDFEENYVSKDKIMKKIDLIDKEYAKIIEKNKNDLYLVNINAQRHSAMQSILEELLGETND